MLNVFACLKIGKLYIHSIVQDVFLYVWCYDSFLELKTDKLFTHREILEVVQANEASSLSCQRLVIVVMLSISMSSSKSTQRLVWFPNPLAAGSGLGERRGQNALFFL